MEIRFEGSTVLDHALVQSTVQPFLGRLPSYETIVGLREAFAKVYEERGFLNSGVVVPSSGFVDGVLTVQIREGHIERIDVVTDGGFRPTVIQKALKGLQEGPANVDRIEAALRRVDADSQIQRVSARLDAENEIGASVLRVRVDESPLWHSTVQAGNDISPSIGGWRGSFSLERERLLGLGDRVGARVLGAEGAFQVEGIAEIPIVPFETIAAVYASGAWSKVVEEPFDSLGLETDLISVGLRIDQRIWSRPDRQLSGFGLVEWRRGQTLISGSPFQFPDANDDGISAVTVLRVGGDWLWRRPSTSVAFRSIFSIGFDESGAPGGAFAPAPDETFFVWLGQAQVAQRVPLLESSLLLRADAQLTPHALVGLERIGVGGQRTVRGYRENLLVANNAAFGSVEWQFPIRITPNWLTLDIFAFVDAARAWDSWSSSATAPSLVSTGLGLRALLWGQLAVNFAWGYPLEEVPTVPDPSLADQGFHFLFTWQPRIGY